MEMDNEQTESGQDTEVDTGKIQKLLESVNIADSLDEDKLRTIGQDAKRGFESDLQSRKEWENNVDDYVKLAKQLAEPKTYPWKNASNVKYPLLSTAAMQFAARAYPSLVPSDRAVVKAKPIGKDPDGKKTDVAEAVSIYMSYQLLEEMEGWEEDMDKLLIILPVIGMVFKKTYWDSVKKVNCSKLVLPKNLVVDYWTKSLPEAERISEIIELSSRKVKERQQADIWLDIDLGKPTTPEGVKNPPQEDTTTPYTFIEQHTFLDLDDDEYPEPYIVTFHRETGKVVRIVARFDQNTITNTEDGDLAKIEPIQYYTKFGFVPNPDGSFYDIGFGVLLGPLNESVNTLINQLIDAGHMSSMQAGFLGKGLRLRMGEQQFKPGEWKVVNSTGTDLKQQILPIPAKEPSTVLFQLMGSLITSGKELASVAEIFVGKMPGQNTPATTTMATIEQGMKVFTAVYKRIYRSLAEEFQKLYRLNSIYTEYDQDMSDVVSMPIGPEAFKIDQHKIYPGADPTAISQTERLMKAQGLMELLPSGVLDPVKVVMRILQAQEQPNWEELIIPQVAQSGQVPPKVDPKVQALQAKSQMDQQAGQQKMAMAQQQGQLDSQGKVQDLQYKQAEAALKLQAQQQLMATKNASQHYGDAAKIAAANQQHQQTIVQDQQKHQLDMQHSQEQNAAKVAAMKQQAKAKPQPKKGKK